MDTLPTMVEFGFGLEHALVDYQKGSADFAEHLRLALARQSGALPFWTFDHKAAKAVGACKR